MNEAGRGGHHRNVVDGTVVGAVVQAATIHGGVHVRLPSPESAPRQLTGPPAIFVGRDAELAELNAAHASLVVLTGPGGVGKTTLAQSWAHDIRAFYPDGQLYLDLQGFSADTAVHPGEALGILLRALGVPAGEVPVTVAEQSAWYRSLTAERALLLMMDNAFSAAQVRVLLPGHGRHLMVVTSRQRLAGLRADGGVEMEVRPLGEDDAVALLEQTLGTARVGREHAHAVAIARSCGGLPMALAVVAARLAARPRLRLGQIAAELDDEANRLRGLRTVDGVSVAGLLDLSYRGLPSSVRAVYMRLVALPAREYASGPIANLAGSIEDGDAAVDLLLQANLLEEVDAGRFRQHDLLYLHARQRFHTDEDETGQIRVRLASIHWYLAAATAADRVLTPYRRRPVRFDFVETLVALPSFERRDQALRWLDDERAGLLNAGQEALRQGWNEIAWHLSDVLWPLFLHRTHRRDRVAADERGVAAACRWGNRWAEADMRMRLGDAYAAAGRDAEAMKQLRLAHQAFRDAGDPLGAIDAEERIASLHRDTGREPEATTMYLRILAANRATGDPRRVGLTLIRLGTILTNTGAPDDAVGHLLEARTIFRDLVAVDPYNGHRVETALARAYLRMGDPAEAAATAAPAVAGLRALGSMFEEAQAVEVLAQAAELRGDEEEGRRHRERALAIYEHLGSPRRPTAGAAPDIITEPAPE